MMSFNKILGYVLLIAGLAMIIFTIFYSYNIFIAKAQAPLVFQTQLIQKSSSSLNSLDFQKQINDSVAQQIGQMIGTDTVPKLLNLLSWSIFATLLILAGSAISGIGVKLIKII